MGVLSQTTCNLQISVLFCTEVLHTCIYSGFILPGGGGAGPLLKKEVFCQLAVPG